MATTKKTRARGSTKVRARAAGRAPASARQLERAVATLDRRGINHDILIKGTPWPDIIRGSLTARNPAELNAALGAIMNVRNIQLNPVKLFPKGIPVIDEIKAEIKGKVRG